MCVSCFWDLSTNSFSSQSKIGEVGAHALECLKSLIKTDGRVGERIASGWAVVHAVEILRGDVGKE